MTMLMPPPEREQFEKEIKQLVSTDKDISNIARYTQRDQAIVSKMFNPNTDEKHNPIYQFVVFLWAFDCLREGLADEVLNIIVRERQKWKPELPRVYGNGAECTSEICKQFSEFLQVELEGKDYDVQIKEIFDVQRAVSLKIQQIIDRRNARYFGESVNK